MSDEQQDSRPFRERVEAALASGLPIPDFPDVSPLLGLAMAQHEAVLAFEKDEKFTRGEALFLVAAMFTNNPGLGPAH